jgi:Flp pilus assembly protein TadD
VCSSDLSLWGPGARSSRPAARRALVVAACLALPVLGWLTSRQIATWRSTQALFDQARRIDPVGRWVRTVGEYNLAVEAGRRGRVEEAMRRYEAIVRDQPDAASARGNLAGLLLQQGRAAEAEPLLRQALVLAPRDVRLLDNLGVAAGLLGRYREALEHFGAALAIDPDDQIAHTNSGWTFERLGDYVRAAAAYREAVRVAPDDPELWERLGESLELTGDVGGAAAAFARARREGRAADGALGHLEPARP